MKRVFGVACAAGACLGGLATTSANAGGIERARPAYSVLFEDGNYLQFSLSATNPTVSGDYSATAVALGGSSSTGNMVNGRSQVGMALKLEVTEQFDLGVILSQPYAADASYTKGFYDGLEARWSSTAIDTILKYNVNERMSVYGGATLLTSYADIVVPVNLANIASDADGPGVGLPGSIISDYTASAGRETDVGFVLGAAYEIPDIAMRVALTYRSAVTHDFKADESYLQLPGVPVNVTTDTEIEMPQSVTLDFQTGVAPETLLFGSVKWTEWSKWEVRPGGYEAETGGNIVSFDNDVFTYSLGVGRQITDDLSLFVRAGYEEKKGGTASRLAPTDGYTSVGFGGSYTMGNTEITAGVEHAWLGDAETSTPTDFSDNTAIGFGFSVGFSF